MNTSILGALNQIAADIGAGRHAVQAIASHLTGADAPPAAFSDPREEIIVRYSVGTGEWAADRRFNVLRMKLFKMDGTPDGTHDGVWEPVVANISDIRTVPSPPIPPLDQPQGPVEHLSPRAFTKANWIFGDGSSIIAIGPAILHLAEFSDTANIFLVTVAGIITNGTGRFAGCRGMKTALGSTFVPAGTDLLNPPGGKFGAVTIETFRVIRAANLNRI